MTAPVHDALATAVLDYAVRGWRIVPLLDREKRPRIKDWSNAASADAEQVEQWWRQWPTANVGVALGTGSGMVSVDLDSDAAEVRMLELAGNEGVPDTLEVVTSPGKRRLLFAIPDSLDFEPETRSIALAAGELRFQSTGAQCVMPPSIHPSGTRYAWVAGRSPAEIAAAPMPGWLIEAMRPKNAQQPAIQSAAPSVNVKQNATHSGPVPEIVANFNRDADWLADILSPKGWTLDTTTADGVTRVTRPGKSGGCSATIGHYQATDGTPGLFVFSGSVPELAANHCYDKFGAYARLNHAGDTAAAIRALAATKRFGRLNPPPRTNGAVPATNGVVAHVEPMDPWGDPIPLDDPCDLPAFPLHCLPPALVDLVCQAAEAVGCPPDYGAAHALGIAGGVIGGAFDLQVKRGHWQTTNLWICVVAPPGSGKSPAVSPILAPVYAEQARRSQMGDKKPVYVSDVTVEKLAQFLQEQHRGLPMIWDEMAGWFSSFNQYKAKGGGNDRTHYLSIWDGRALKVDRKGPDSPPVFVRYPRLSVVGGIQPEVLDGLREGPSDGLLDRILFVFPKDNGLSVETFAEVAAGAETAWAAALKKLWELPDHVDEVGGRPRPGRITLNDDGRPVWQAWTKELHDRASEPLAPPFFRQVAAKLQGYAARLALVTHLLFEAYGMSSAYGVDEADMRRGVDLARYFLAHADRVQRSAGRDERVVAAKILVRWLTNRDCDAFTCGEAWDSLRRNSQFSQPEDLNAPLRLLRFHRIIRWKEVAGKSGAGRPAEQAYEINPALFGRRLIGVHNAN